MVVYGSGAREHGMQNAGGVGGTEKVSERMVSQVEMENRHLNQWK